MDQALVLAETSDPLPAYYIHLALIHHRNFVDMVPCHLPGNDQTTTTTENRTAMSSPWLPFRRPRDVRQPIPCERLGAKHYTTINQGRHNEMSWRRRRGRRTLVRETRMRGARRSFSMASCFAKLFCPHVLPVFAHDSFSVSLAQA